MEMSLYNWIQFGIFLATTAGVVIGMYFKLKQTNREMFKQEIAKYEDMARITNEIEMLKDRFRLLDQQAGNDRAEFKKLVEDLKNDLRRIYDKIDEHNRLFHTKDHT